MKRRTLFAMALCISCVFLFLYNPISEEKENTHYTKVYGEAKIDIYKFKSNETGPKVAFILGVHPYEWEAHNAFYDAIKTYTSTPKFRGEIDVYWIHVPEKYAKNWSEGRNFGNMAANKYIVPMIQSEGYDAVFDIHSAWEEWPSIGRPKWFILYPPTKEGKSLSQNITKNVNWIKIMGNCSQSKEHVGYWVEMPLAKNKIPIVILEWGWCEPEKQWLKYKNIDLNATIPGEYEDKLNHALIFLDNLDKIVSWKKTGTIPFIQEFSPLI